jgi:DNA end-binding protein Ku
MARAIWKGTISFGLVNVPIALYPAERRADLHFTLLDARNKAHVRYQRVNEVTGEEVPWDEVVKAYEYQDGDYVVIEDEEFKRVAVEATQTIDIEALLPCT